MTKGRQVRKETKRWWVRDKGKSSGPDEGFSGTVWVCGDSDR